MGYTQLLYLKIPDDENREKLSKIEKNSDELCHILEQLRQYFQKGKNIKARCNLNDILHHMDSYFDNIRKQKQIIKSVVVHLIDEILCRKLKRYRKFKPNDQTNTLFLDFQAKRILIKKDSKTH